MATSEHFDVSIRPPKDTLAAKHSRWARRYGMLSDGKLRWVRIEVGIQSFRSARRDTFDARVVTMDPRAAFLSGKFLDQLRAYDDEAERSRAALRLYFE